MKRKGLFITILSTMLLGVGVFAGVSSVSENAPVEKAEAASYSGSVIIKKNDNNMRWTGCKLTAWLFAGNTGTWGTAVQNTDTLYQVYSWEGLAFNPTGIIILRVADNWSKYSDPWKNPYCRTGDITLDDLSVIWMNGDASSDGNYGTYTVDAVVKGGASQDWTTPTVNTRLSNIKVNEDGVLEAYGTVTLEANTYFKTLKANSTWCGAYSAHDSIKSNFNGGGSSNIHNIKAGTYEFYFDYEGCSTYITDPVYAAADEWAQYFLSHVGCDSTGVKLPTGWSNCATEYGKLTGASKDLIYGATAKQDGSYIEKAVARYDHALVSHPTLDRFIKNSSNVSRAVSSPFGIPTETNNTQATITIVVTTLISVVAVGGFFLLKRKAR